MRISDWSSDVCSSDLCFYAHGIITTSLHFGVRHLSLMGSGVTGWECRLLRNQRIAWTPHRSSGQPCRKPGILLSATWSLQVNCLREKHGLIYQIDRKSVV